MSTSDEEVMEIIILEIGDVDPTTGDSPPARAQDGVLENLVPQLWDLHASRDMVAPGLRALYVRRDALRRVMAIGAQKWFDSADNLSGLSVRGNQIYKHYQDMYDCAKAEIESVQKAAAVGSVVSGRMTATYPSAPGDTSQHYVTRKTAEILGSP